MRRRRTNCTENSARPAHVGKRCRQGNYGATTRVRVKAVVVGTPEKDRGSGKGRSLSRLTCESGIRHCCRCRSRHCRDPMRSRQCAPAKIHEPISLSLYSRPVRKGGREREDSLANDLSPTDDECPRLPFLLDRAGVVRSRTVSDRDVRERSRVDCGLFYEAGEEARADSFGFACAARQSGRRGQRPIPSLRGIGESDKRGRESTCLVPSGSTS